MRGKFIAITVLITLVAFIQPADDFVQTLSSRLAQFRNQLPQVKLFLFFNQRVYSPGDTAFFSARVLSEELTPMAGRQLIRVELVNDAGKIIQFDNVLVKDGFAADQIIIPTNLNAGAYSWVASSNWMRNFDFNLYFKEDFILETGKELIPNRHIHREVQFFPEGGSLVAQATNRVVMVGEPGHYPIQILDTNEKLVTAFTMNESGYASFSITPQSGVRYVAEFSVDHKLVRHELPAANLDGITIQLNTAASPARLNLNIPTNSKYRSSKLWMIIAARSEIYFAAPVVFSEGNNISIQFANDQLPTGICYATLFDDAGVVMAERLFAVENNKTVVNIDVQDSPFKTREKIKLSVNLKDESGNLVSGYFSIAVINRKFVQEFLPPTSIINYLTIHSDIYSLKNFYSNEILDEFLITQKNARLPWDKIWKGDFSIKHSFSDLIQYSGIVKNVAESKPLPDSSRLLVYLQENKLGYETKINSKGEFDLPLLIGFWGEDKLFFVVENKQGKKQAVNVAWAMDSESPIKPIVSVFESERQSLYFDFQAKKRAITKSYNFFASQDSLRSNKLTDPNYDYEDELSGADFTANVSDYLVFPSMEDLIREVVPWLQHRKVRGKSQVRVFLSDDVKAQDDPLYIIDGVLTHNTDFFLQLKPRDLIALKVVRTYSKLITMGPIARNGVVLVHTKGVDKGLIETANDLLPIKGLTKQIPFVADLTNQKASRMPIFRSTLYWNPNQKITQSNSVQISFPATDDVGTFLIYVKGITYDGKPFEATDSLKVEFGIQKE